MSGQETDGRRQSAGRIEHRAQPKEHGVERRTFKSD